MSPLCQHTLLEFHGCDPAQLRHARKVRVLMREAVLRGRGTIVKSLFHNFSPFGVSGVIVITESHVTIHTWPEHNYAAVDIFSCSEKLDHKAIRQRLRETLLARRVSARSFSRGKLPKNLPRVNKRPDAR